MKPEQILINALKEYRDAVGEGFIKSLVDNQKPMPPEFAKMVDDHWDELLDDKPIKEDG